MEGAQVFGIEKITPPMWLVMIVAACVIDWTLGDSRKILNPVFPADRAIHHLVGRLNRGKASRLKGAALWITLTGLTLILLSFLQNALLLFSYPLGIVLLSFFMSCFLSMKSLKDGSLFRQDESGAEGVKRARAYADHIRKKKKETGTRYGMLRAMIEVSVEYTVDEILSPLLYMAFGVVAEQGISLLNPLTLPVIYLLTRSIADERREGKVSAFLDFPCIMDRMLRFVPVRISAFLLIVSGGLLGYDERSGMKQLMGKKSGENKDSRLQPAIAKLFHLRFSDQKEGGEENATAPSQSHVESVFVMVELSEVLILCFCSFIAALFYLPAYIDFFI